MLYTCCIASRNIKAPPTARSDSRALGRGSSSPASLMTNTTAKVMVRSTMEKPHSAAPLQPSSRLLGTGPATGQLE